LKLEDVAGAPIATTQVGKFARPAWYKFNIGDKGWLEACAEQGFLESYTDGVRAIISDHEQSGLDIMTDGCLRYDEDISHAIAPWPTNNVAYMSGLRRIAGIPQGKNIGTSAQGFDPLPGYELITGRKNVLLKSAWSWVIEDTPDVGKLELWTETAKIALANTRKPYKFSAVSIAESAYRCYNKTGRSDRDVYFDLLKVQNKVLRQVADAGVKLIQIDYPFGLAHFLANASDNAVSRDTWKGLVEMANEEIAGVNAYIIYHFCFVAPNFFSQYAPHQEWNMSNVYPYIADSMVNCIQSGAANTEGKYLDLELKAWKEHCFDKDYMVAAVTPFSFLETWEDVDEIVKKALNYVPPERLGLTSEEGLSGHGNVNRETCIMKMTILAQAAMKARNLA
jgi:methionine synthase II (cobalamin-independent)